MGVFTISFGAALVLMQLLVGGQVAVLIRESAQQPAAARALYQQARRCQRGLSVVVLPAAVLATVTMVAEEPLRWTLLAFVPYAWLRAWLITAGAVFKGQDRMDVEVAARGLEVVFALALLVLVVGLAMPVWLTGAAFTAGAWAGTAWIVARLGKLAWGEKSRYTAAGLAQQGWPFLALAILSQWLLRGDVLVQAGLGVPAAYTGLYGAATAPVWGLFGVAQLVAVAIYPTAARLAELGRLGFRVVVVMAVGGAGLGAGAGLALWLGRHPMMVGMFGAPFADAVELVEVLVWALPCACAAMVLGIVVAACRRQNAAMMVQAVVVSVSLAGNLWFIPRWGVVGSARVAVVAHALSALLMLGLALWSVLSFRGRAPAPSVGE